MPPSFKGIRYPEGHAWVWVLKDGKEDARLTGFGSDLLIFNWSNDPGNLEILAAAMLMEVLGGKHVSDSLCAFVALDLLQDLGQVWKIPFSRMLDSVARAGGLAGSFKPGEKHVD